MKHIFPPLLFLSIVVLGCRKEEVPEPEVETPTESPGEQTIVEMSRRVSVSENWSYTDTIDTLSCKGPYEEDDVFTGIMNDTVFLAIVPDKSGCYYSNKVRTPIKDSEISDAQLDDLTFEFTYMQLTTTAASEVWMRLHYGNLELELDLADAINHIQGVVKVQFKDNLPVIYDNEDLVNIDWNDPETKHSFTATGDPMDNFFETQLVSQGTLGQTFLKYSYLRLTSTVVK